MDLQDPTFADETDPPVCPPFLHPGLDLSQQLPEFLEPGLGLRLDLDEILLSDLTLCDLEESSGPVNGEVMVGRLGEVELRVGVGPVEACGRDL